ncbi:hypothetical protein MJO29_005933 [Puccinia striiformis f. sp. tritici]|nr:hypothetical protein MJO29_005933 [Puccinia striiformis f. sp. tritici]
MIGHDLATHLDSETDKNDQKAETPLDTPLQNQKQDSFNRLSYRYTLHNASLKTRGMLDMRDP